MIRREVTAERVGQHFAAICRGRVDRFEVPNLLALNFLLHDSLGGGGTLSLKTDAQGKTHGQGLLAMEVEVSDELLSWAPDSVIHRRAETGGGAELPARGAAGAARD